MAPSMHQLAGIPAGPVLAAELESLDPDTVPAADAVAVLRAWSRQRAHDHARLARTIARVARLTRAAGAGHGEGDWAGMEIAAALTWTDGAAGRELDFAETLIGLPLVLEAFESGRIDHGKARVFTDVLSVAELTTAQVEKVCAALVPVAPRLTAGQLRHRLLRAVLAVDPEYARRRYRRALGQARVHGYLTADGTAVITASGLAADEAAAACARVDALADVLRRGGHPGTVNQIRTRVFVWLLDGRLTGLSHDEIVAVLLADPPEDPTADAGAGDSAGQADAAQPAAADKAGAAAADKDDADEDDAAEPAADDEPAADAEPAHTASPAGAAERGDIAESAEPADAEPAADEDDTAEPVAAGGAIAAGVAAGEGGPADVDGVAGRCDGLDSDQPEPDAPGPVPSARPAQPVRGPAGVEIRVGLLTLLGLDTRPGDIPGWGPVLPDTARALVARQRAAHWRYALLDDDGHLLLAGATSCRPTTTGAGPRAVGGIVELHITVDALIALDPHDHPGWAKLIASLVRCWGERHRLRALLDAHPESRFARGALARHIRVRDRTCVAPGCRRPAAACQLDHTVDHTFGGVTTCGNTGPLCARHHLLKHGSGWRLAQPEPGFFRWTSPLGHPYDTRGEPVSPPLPEPVERSEGHTAPEGGGPVILPGATFDPRPARPPGTGEQLSPPPPRPSPWKLPRTDDPDPAPF